MQVTESKSDGLSREFTIAIPAETFDAKIHGRLSEIARQVKLPGFRPGKVPAGLIRKRYGDAIKSEVVEEVIKESTTSVMSDRGLKPASTPEIDITRAEEGAGIEFTMAVDVLPEITPPDFSTVSLERLVAEPTDEEIVKTLEELAKAQRDAVEIAEARPAREGDIVVVDFVGSIDGEEFDGGKAEGFELELGSGTFIPGFEERLVGIAKGEARTIAISFPADYRAERLAGKDARFEVTCAAIKELTEPVIDDALAKKLGAQNVEDLRGQIAEEHRRRLKELTRLKLKRDLLDKLSEIARFDVPPKLVGQEFDSIVRQMKPEAAPDAHDHDHDHHHDHEHSHDHDHDHDHAHDHDHDHAHDHDHDHAHDHDHPDDHGQAAKAELTDAERAEYQALAERRVRLGLLLSEVSRANNLQVSTEELNRAIYQEASKYQGQEQLVFKYFRDHPEAAQSLAAPILEDKVVDFILEIAQVSDRSVSVDDLVKADADADDGDAPEESAADGKSA